MSYDNFEPPKPKPWYEDGDRASSVAATIVMTGLAIAVALVVVGIGVWIFNWLVSR